MFYVYRVRKKNYLKNKKEIIQNLLLINILDQNNSVLVENKIE